MWKSLSIAQKIWVGIFVLILGYFVSMVLGFIFSKQTEKRLDGISKYHFLASQKSQSALNLFKEQLKMYNDAVILGDASQIETAQKNAEEVQKEVLENIEDVIKLAARNKVLIYHHVRGSFHYYFIHLPEGIYYSRLKE